MKLRRRFALNLLAPSPLAATLLICTFSILEKRPLTEALRWLPIFILFGYIYAILPSLAHAWWLHRNYHRGLDPRSCRAIGFSSASGFCAGFVIGLITGNAGAVLMFILLGATTGAINGLLQFLIREEH